MSAIEFFSFGSQALYNFASHCVVALLTFTSPSVQLLYLLFGVLLRFWDDLQSALQCFHYLCRVVFFQADVCNHRDLSFCKLDVPSTLFLASSIVFTQIIRISILKSLFWHYSQDLAKYFCLPSPEAEHLSTQIERYGFWSFTLLPSGSAYMISHYS